MKLTILFDNVPFREDMQPLWGFACWVEDEGKAPWLFDTGSNGRVLLANAQKAGADLSRAAALVISHPHWDHVGGIDSVLEINSGLHLYLPESLSKHWIEDLEKMSGGVTVVGEEPQPLFDGVVSTGIMSEVGEQAAIIHSDKGPVVLTGCAHPGIVEIVARATELCKEPLALLMGGFHLFRSDEEEIAEVIEGLIALGVRQVCPTHCTGERATAMFREAFGEDCLRGGVGAVVEL
ncbi:MBL fold metallo-hydrolase [Nitratifractor salsuginis]|uniref:Metal-dependent hydrolase of the beta-lactamase superfamily n=1 Tax=Nitratifractor salsuginis (strain DSM 16511 / JCM 12458 / E9I37-1) TaxID=749222 RepID=E6WYI1_NITSE|nr:MBL fold metallo-hydrolase [Nitratifractor salsuginis]ADV46493.1 metal-dependent hydrolase of the beta-lactamase superfamily [Nitratifractor salsuginis DSM 16511]